MLAKLILPCRSPRWLPHFAVVPSLPLNDDCSAHEHIGWADQARSFRNVARPRHWPLRSVSLTCDEAVQRGL